MMILRKDFPVWIKNRQPAMRADPETATLIFRNKIDAIRIEAVGIIGSVRISSSPACVRIVSQQAGVIGAEPYDAILRLIKALHDVLHVVKCIVAQIVKTEFFLSGDEI